MDTSVPSTIPNKPLDVLICDTDALAQIHCANHEHILRTLHTKYGVAFAVHEAVEGEILNPRHRKAWCAQTGFRKWRDAGLLTVLTRGALGKFTSSNPITTYDSIDLKGQEYNRVLDRGEAYTHAAAYVLKCCVLSNDFDSLIEAEGAGLTLDHPTLRVYDLIVFLYQSGDIDEKDCDGFRKALQDVDESPHSVFAKRKFREGLPNFYPRLINPDLEIPGCTTMTQLGDKYRAELRLRE